MSSLSEDKRFARNRALVILVTAGVFIAAWFYAPFVERGPVVCPSRALVGLPCPACGLTHAFCDLAHGRVSAAAGHNALAFPLAALFAVALPVAALELRRGKPFAFYGFLYSMRLAWSVGAIVLVYHLTRVAFMVTSGRLMTDYVMTSWPYHLFVQR